RSVYQCFCGAGLDLGKDGRSIEVEADRRRAETIEETLYGIGRSLSTLSQRSVRVEQGHAGGFAESNRIQQSSPRKRPELRFGLRWVVQILHRIRQQLLTAKRGFSHSKSPRRESIADC